MGRLFIFLGGILLLANSDAWAKKPYGMAGCGLGSLVMSPGGNQSSAATTNGTSGNQTFAITLGTSNCKTAGEMALIQEQETFFFANLSTLSKEMAQGSGDALATFTQKLGCSQDIQPQVAQQLQSNYGEIFKAPGAVAQLSAAKSAISANQDLANNCTYLF